MSLWLHGEEDFVSEAGAMNVFLLKQAPDGCELSEVPPNVLDQRDSRKVLRCTFRRGSCLRLTLILRRPRIHHHAPHQRDRPPRRHARIDHRDGQCACEWDEGIPVTRRAEEGEGAGARLQHGGDRKGALGRDRGRVSRLVFFPSRNRAQNPPPLSWNCRVVSLDASLPLAATRAYALIGCSAAAPASSSFRSARSNTPDRHTLSRLIQSSKSCGTQ